MVKSYVAEPLKIIQKGKKHFFVTISLCLGSVTNGEALQLHLSAGMHQPCPSPKNLKIFLMSKICLQNSKNFLDIHKIFGTSRKLFGRPLGASQNFLRLLHSHILMRSLEIHLSMHAVCLISWLLVVLIVAAVFN